MTRPGLDSFVLGFPEGMLGGARFPIWKRASIASEPDIDIDDLPKLYVDTATRNGMSGAPVYLQKSGLITPEGKTMKESYFGVAYKFIGIYSGRIGEDAFNAQLGIVWKEKAILETIHGNQKGRSPFFDF